MSRSDALCPMPCIFCDIVDGKIPSRKAYEDDSVVAFHDVNPQAPTHILVVPRKHVATLNDLGPEDSALAGEMIRREEEAAGGHAVEADEDE